MAFWSSNDPALRDDAANLAAAHECGWRVAGTFPLPATAWAAYHVPLRARLPALRARDAGEAETIALVDTMETEIELMARHAACVGCSCYVLQRS